MEYSDHVLWIKVIDMDQPVFVSQTIRKAVVGRKGTSPTVGISNVIWMLSSDTICQLNQSLLNSEATMLFNLVRKKYECSGSENRSDK